MSVLAIRLDFGLSLRDHPQQASAVGEILTRPCFASLARLSARQGDRWGKHVVPTQSAIATYLQAPENDAVYFDTVRDRELDASAEIENGQRNQDREPHSTRFFAYAVVPLTESWRDVVQNVLDLARVVEVGAGMISAEPTYALGQRFALGVSAPKRRPGLSDQRMRERRARHWKRAETATRLAGIEWGTFVSEEHLKHIDVSKLRASSVFARIDEINARLVYFQITDAPVDDLSDGGIEEKLETARRALAPLMVDISDVPAQ
jgi:hypothetical protein